MPGTLLSVIAWVGSQRILVLFFQIHLNDWTFPRFWLSPVLGPFCVLTVLAIVNGAFLVYVLLDAAVTVCVKRERRTGAIFGYLAGAAVLGATMFAFLEIRDAAYALRAAVRADNALHPSLLLEIPRRPEPRATNSPDRAVVHVQLSRTEHALEYIPEETGVGPFHDAQQLAEWVRAQQTPGQASPVLVLRPRGDACWGDLADAVRGCFQAGFEEVGVDHSIPFSGSDKSTPARISPVWLRALPICSDELDLPKCPSQAEPGVILLCAVSEADRQGRADDQAAPGQRLLWVDGPFPMGRLSPDPWSSRCYLLAEWFYSARREASVTSGQPLRVRLRAHRNLLFRQIRFVLQDMHSRLPPAESILSQ